MVGSQSHAFPAQAKRTEGRGSYCKTCMLARSKASYRKRRSSEGTSVREAEDLGAGSKRCLDCGEVKPFEAFPSNKGTSDGRHAYCKPCHNARGAETRERLYGGSRNYHLQHRYGISEAEFDAMLEAQGGLGQFKDRVDIMRKAIDYIERTTWQRTLVSAGVYQLTSPQREAASPPSSERHHLTSSRRS